MLWSGSTTVQPWRLQRCVTDKQINFPRIIDGWRFAIINHRHNVLSFWPEKCPVVSSPHFHREERLKMQADQRKLGTKPQSLFGSSDSAENERETRIWVWNYFKSSFKFQLETITQNLTLTRLNTLTLTLTLTPTLTLVKYCNSGFSNVEYLIHLKVAVLDDALHIEYRNTKLKKYNQMILKTPHIWSCDTWKSCVFSASCVKMSSRRSVVSDWEATSTDCSTGFDVWCVTCSTTVHLRAMEHHLPYGITQCHLPPNTGKHAMRFCHSQTGWYSIYLPRRDGRLSWPLCWLYIEMVYLSADRHSSKHTVSQKTSHFGIVHIFAK